MRAENEPENEKERQTDTATATGSFKWKIIQMQNVGKKKLTRMQAARERKKL